MSDSLFYLIFHMGAWSSNRATWTVRAPRRRQAKRAKLLWPIRSAAHLSNVEQSQAFNAALLGFIERAAK